MYLTNLPEEELKNKVTVDFFSPNPQSENIKLDKEQKALLKTLDSTQILGNIDCCVNYSLKLALTHKFKARIFVNTISFDRI
ncbi:hypothetical protein Q2X75_000073 [Campylobacter upsaliensis]|nr:hypothetical protein [Campylobacter upsaliensis]